MVEARLVVSYGGGGAVGLAEVGVPVIPHQDLRPVVEARRRKVCAGQQRRQRVYLHTDEVSLGQRSACGQQEPR